MADSTPARPDARHRLATYVVVLSFVTIGLLVAALLAIGQAGSPAAAALAEKTFNVIIPVLAGWVGTVLAFYFSAQGAERTSNTLDRALGQIGGTPASKSVSETMIPVAGIRGLIKLGGKDDKDDKDVKIKDLQDAVKKDPRITRIIVTDDGKFKYVIHVGPLDKYVADVLGSSSADQVSSPPDQGSSALDDKTLATFVTDADIKKQVSELVAFVSPDQTISDAKNKLDSVSGAQDIIVTVGGHRDELMLGWISNVDLIKALSG